MNYGPNETKRGLNQHLDQDKVKGPMEIGTKPWSKRGMTPETKPKPTLHEDDTGVNPGLIYIQKHRAGFLSLK